MSVRQFENLLQLVKPHLLKRSRRESLRPEERLAMTLKYLAQGGSRQSIAWEFRVGKSTFSKVVVEVCTVLWNVLSSEYMKEPSQAEWQNIMQQFWSKWNFPNCQGAIDGKHVRCKCFSNTGSEYFNYKKHFSIVLMACCNADYTFTWVDVGDYGSKNDASIFTRSVFGQMVMENQFQHVQPLPGTNVMVPSVFVADAAFPLKDCIMRPFPGRNLAPEEVIFNYRLSRARRTIENTFGVLAARWQIYHQALSGSPQTVTKLVLATTALHNYIMKTNAEQYMPRTFVTDEMNVADLAEEHSWRSSVGTQLGELGRAGANIGAQTAYSVRDQFKNFLISPAGEVSWQWSEINRGYGVQRN